jgi:hypothetical protein
MSWKIRVAANTNCRRIDAEILEEEDLENSEGGLFA